MGQTWGHEDVKIHRSQHDLSHKSTLDSPEKYRHCSCSCHGTGQRDAPNVDRGEKARRLGGRGAWAMSGGNGRRLRKEKKV